MADFDRAYWERHWGVVAPAGSPDVPAHPYLATETAHLSPGTALDAGCGAGAEALWLAARGWLVTAADISATALSAARARARATKAGRGIEWVETDLSRWQPRRTWDLVVTSYAHPEGGQLPFYRRIGSWVASAGTLLIVAHLPAGAHGDRREHPDGSSAGVPEIIAALDAPGWRVEAAYEHSRTAGPRNSPVLLRDVVVRALRTA